MGDDEEPTHDPAAGESDEEDEDYVPGADPDEPRDGDDDDGLGDAGATDAAPALSASQLRAVDDAFLDLFGYPYNNTAAGKKSDAKLPVKGKRAIPSRKERILASIFGKRASLQLLSRAKATAASARPKPSTGGMIRLEKRVVTEVKRFAGQEIRVERVVVVPVMKGEDDDAKMNDATTTSSAAAESSGAAGGPTTRKGKAKGVDSLLAELDKPEKLSTISKTSADWDLFKNKEADESLKEQLEAKAKGNEAYLVKKDFLNRVDTRRFELEKAERDKKRARRGK